MYYIVLREQSDCFFYLSDISNEECRSKSFSFRPTISSPEYRAPFRPVVSIFTGQKPADKHQITNRISKIVNSLRRQVRRLARHIQTKPPRLTRTVGNYGWQ